jgi:DNA-binding transcriptional LysR family regulator
MRKTHEAAVRELQQFVEVAQRKSISGAAKHLHISQPALSRSIQKLEESYGAPLFVRNGAGVELSPFGMALYARAIRILPAIEEARDEIRQLQGKSRAILRIGAGDLWGLVILPQVTRRFAETHGNALVHVEIVDQAKRLQGVRDGIYELAFGTFAGGQDSNSSLHFEPMVSQGTSLYADAGHALVGKAGVLASALMNHRWINPGYEDDGGPIYPGAPPRDFAARVDTVMHAVQLLRTSPFLMSASSGFERLFSDLGIRAIDVEDHAGTSGARASGAAYPVRTLKKPMLRDFLRLARQRAQETLYR